MLAEPVSANVDMKSVDEPISGLKNEAGDAEKKDADASSSSSSLLGAGPSVSLEVLHPLQHTWVLWYDSSRGKSNQQTWGDNLKKISTFSTVEDFWRLYNNICTASNIGPSSNYHLFKKGIDPAWEDPVNLKGGKWIFPSPTKARAARLDTFWLWTVLACIGENFEESEDVCGAVVSIRKQQDKICLWTRSAHNQAVSMSIGRQWKMLLELEPTQTLGYQVHADAMKHNSSFNNRMHYQV
eukprot:CAMPEP_0177647210 /NCGR_PEP_ID=MMETSP0447-20121125/10180_1 /TAXON_ID=0 /ORGANISM="Stygamoeba regulata, Strain BSH-02190019" /LENGTH=239 /DNA_ID=CAMNT_0019149783 /DNA_START=147 /DNA_END=866 /DNA_ORIENTATION=-